MVIIMFVKLNTQFVSILLYIVFAAFWDINRLNLNSNFWPHTKFVFIIMNVKGVKVINNINRLFYSSQNQKFGFLRILGDYVYKNVRSKCALRNFSSKFSRKRIHLFQKTVAWKILTKKNVIWFENRYCSALCRFMSNNFQKNWNKFVGFAVSS